MHNFFRIEFHIAFMQEKFCRNCPHYIKGEAGLFYKLSISMIFPMRL
jgi:hypothetical protein